MDKNKSVLSDAVGQQNNILAGGNLSNGLLTKMVIIHVAPFPKRGLYSK